jgi:NTP pyrophosphatase (non-canonical NTP hydrolase)
VRRLLSSRVVIVQLPALSARRKQEEAMTIYTEEQVRALLRELFAGTWVQEGLGEQAADMRGVELAYDAESTTIRVTLTLEQGKVERLVPLPQPLLCQQSYTEEVLRTYMGEDTWVDKLTLGALGLAGEAGEVVDAIKKWSYQGHLLDQEALLLELGDVLWYLALIGSVFGWELEQMVEANVAKLRKRYPEGFEGARASMVREQE